jgi:hypothetical protein
MRTAIFAAVLLSSLVASEQHALADEPYTITIPGQGWYVSFESPPLRQFQGETRGKDFAFQATEKKAFNLSMFVEEPKEDDGTHEDCYDHYWPLAKRNPLIDQDSVKVEKGDKFVKVTYQVNAGNVNSLNANYYFAFHGRWIDLHVSFFPSAADDKDKLAAFEKSLVYQTFEDKKKEK